jgi:hypothetical protein
MILQICKMDKPLGESGQGWQKYIHTFIQAGKW